MAGSWGQKNRRTLDTPRSQQTPWNSGSALGTLDGDTCMLEDPQGILQAGTNLQKSWPTERVDKSGGLGEAWWSNLNLLQPVIYCNARNSLGPMDKTLEDLKLNHKTSTILHRFFFADLPKSHIALCPPTIICRCGLLVFLRVYPSQKSRKLSNKRCQWIIFQGLHHTLWNQPRCGGLRCLCTAGGAVWVIFLVRWSVGILTWTFQTTIFQWSYLFQITFFI